jgi:hypothetical protein
MMDMTIDALRRACIRLIIAVPIAIDDVMFQFSGKSRR